MYADYIAPFVSISVLFLLYSSLYSLSKVDKTMKIPGILIGIACTIWLVGVTSPFLYWLK